MRCIRSAKEKPREEKGGKWECLLLVSLGDMAVI